MTSREAGEFYTEGSKSALKRTTSLRGPPRGCSQTQTIVCSTSQRTMLRGITRHSSITSEELIMETIIIMNVSFGRYSLLFILQIVMVVDYQSTLSTPGKKGHKGVHCLTSVI